MDKKNLNFIDEGEVQPLIIALANARGEKGFTEEEVQRLFAEINVHRFFAACINNAVKGLMVLDIGDDGLIVKKA